MPDNSSSDTSEYTGRIYTLTIGGTEYGQDTIADPVFSAAAPNHGMYGIATSSFSCDVFTGAGNEASILQLAPCSELSFSELPGMTFILTDADFRGKGVVSITAYTRFVNSDVTMTAETFQERSSTTGKLLTYSCQSVASAALGIMYGTGGFPASIGAEPYLYVSEFKGKTVRRVLEEIAKVNGGYFFDNSGAPDFAEIGGDSKGVLMVTNDYYSAVSPVQIKNVSRIFATDSLSNDVYEIGTGEYYNTETLSGDYLMGESICRTAASKLCRQYAGWKCDSILADGFTPVLHADINFSGSVLTAENITVKYTKNHSVLSAGADRFSIAFTDYSDMKQRAIDSKLTANKTYGNSGIDSAYGVYFTMDKTDGGISPLSDSTERGENYYFSTKSGGMTSYEGVMSSSKEASNVSVDKSSGTVTVTYSDGHVYKYSANVTETSNGYNITNETEEWT